MKFLNPFCVISFHVFPHMVEVAAGNPAAQGLQEQPDAAQRTRQEGSLLCRVRCMFHNKCGVFHGLAERPQQFSDGAGALFLYSSSRFPWRQQARTHRTMPAAASTAITTASVPLGIQGPPSQRRRKQKGWSRSQLPSTAPTAANSGRALSSIAI